MDGAEALLALASDVPPRVVVVAAHPDDEVIGAAVRLARAEDAWVVHVTDGAPRDPALWPEAMRGSTREAYAATRRREAAEALAIAGLAADRVVRLGLADQEVASRIAALVVGLATVLGELRPAIAITHAYEGGHPDHDAVAFAARAAVDRLAAARVPRPVLVEMTGYHAEPRTGALRVGCFLPAPGWPELALGLGASERARRQSMLAAHRSQRDVLAPFDVAIERYRLAPRYAFDAPPHDGPLWYERLGWPARGRAVVGAFADASRELAGGGAC